MTLEAFLNSVQSLQFPNYLNAVSCYLFHPSSTSVPTDCEPDMSSPAANLPPRLQNFSLSERGRTYIIVFSILEFFVFTTVALRCISKRNNRTIGLDDWLILLALFFELGVYVTGVLANVLGFGGFHVWELYPDQISLCLLVSSEVVPKYSLTQ